MSEIAIIGAKSFPNSYGGFETLLETLIRNKSFRDKFTKINVIVEFPPNSIVTETYDNVEFIAVNISKSKNPFLFYWRSLLQCRKCRAVLILGLAAGFYLPIIKLIFPQISWIVNVDGLEWHRSKFNFMKRFILYALAIFNILFANKLIFDNKKLTDCFPLAKRFHSAKENVIPYSSRFETLAELSSKPPNDERYFIAIARFVPENNILMLCNAYCEANLSNTVKFIFVGDVENYPSPLRNMYPEIDFVGPIYNLEHLNSLISNCSLYLHGHTVGGSNPALIEALHLNCNVLCHKNVFNIETTKSKAHYFASEDELKNLLISWESLSKYDAKKIYNDYYSSAIISELYVKVLSDALNLS